MERMEQLKEEDSEHEDDIAQNYSAEDVSDCVKYLDDLYSGKIKSNNSRVLPINDVERCFWCSQQSRMRKGQRLKSAAGKSIGYYLSWKTDNQPQATSVLCARNLQRRMTIFTNVQQPPCAAGEVQP
eukprot:scaffold3614_cov88-Cylindrotheca_fusiformis.AAC.2